MTCLLLFEIKERRVGSSHVFVCICTPCFGFYPNWVSRENANKMFEYETPRSQKKNKMQDEYANPLLLLAQTLQVHKLEVSSPLCQEFVMCSVLDNSALVEDEDHVGFLNGR